jgi:hypothetical protein
LINIGHTTQQVSFKEFNTIPREHRWCASTVAHGVASNVCGNFNSCGTQETFNNENKSLSYFKKNSKIKAFHCRHPVYGSGVKEFKAFLTLELDGNC